MRVKAIQDLAQLPDPAFFEQVQEGMALCVSNAKRISDDCMALMDTKRVRGADILRIAAEEEGAKVLILLDAVRCPRAALPAEFGRQLQYFNDHLAKGIYAEYCRRRPATFEDVGRWVNRERKEFYLDGPNDVDWIFYNDILRRREETIYVDFVENDGQHVWHDPMMLEAIGLPFMRRTESPVLRLLNALTEAGCLASSALEIIAKVWRPAAIDEAFSWPALQELTLKTLEAMEQRGLLKTHADDVCAVIVNEWSFPMYALDLRKERVDKNELRQAQQQWSAGSW